MIGGGGMIGQRPPPSAVLILPDALRRGAGLEALAGTLRVSALAR